MKKSANEKSLGYALIVSKINTILRQDDRIEAAYLLGSIVSGRMHPQSDIDLAVLPDLPKSLGTMDRLKLSARLQDELPYDIDIGILGTHDLIFAAQTILHGQCIYFRERYKKDLFAATCLALYTDLKRQRIEVEHAYRT
jgi:predicted nucleotidyltransferase